MTISVLPENNHRVLVLGGDGFCGWPTALRLSQQGYDVTIVDNLSRRKIDVELEIESLTPIRPMGTRLAAWHELTGRQINFVNLDVAREYGALKQLIEEFQPESIVHFAEQRAAPYSMKSSWHKRYTVSNNLNATNNVLAAIVETGVESHLVHLGTMGVYGYATGIPIPEGYLEIQVDDMAPTEILYPASPGSIYHMTKTQDALMFAFYAKNDHVPITDLHQGIVWGTNTAETDLDERLVNRFDYGSDYGTVLNRFLVQAAVGHPLTVYGTGGQTRAFINIQDTVKCVQIAIESRPAAGERVQIFNQVTQTHTVGDLAEAVAKLTSSEVRYYRNPRVEAAENELNVTFEKFLDLGLDPVHLEDGLMDEVVQVANKYADRCDMSKILAVSMWRSDIEPDFEGSSEPV